MISAEENNYIDLYNNFHSDLNNYNDKIYSNWVYQELSKLCIHYSMDQIKSYI